MKLLDTIRVPWTPYALTFSRDGTRLAVGGGTYIGSGAIIIRHLDGGAEERLRWQDYVDNRDSAGGLIPRRPSSPGTQPQ